MTSTDATQLLDTVVGFDQLSIRDRFKRATEVHEGLFSFAFATSIEHQNRLYRNRRDAETKLQFAEDLGEITFSLGEIVALGFHLLLEEADARWSDELDTLLEANIRGVYPNGPAFAAESQKLERRIRRQRDKATKGATGATYAAWVKFLG